MAGAQRNLWLVVAVVVMVTLPIIIQAKSLHGPCDFETEDLCGMAGFHYFRVHEGRPSMDYEAMNSGYSGSGYLLLEDFNEENVMETPALSHGSEGTDVHFAYYLNGRGDGHSYLKLVQEVDGEEAELVWEASQHDHSWHYVSVTLRIPEGASFKVKWAALAHSNQWMGQKTYLGLDLIEVVTTGGSENCYRPPPVQYADPWQCTAPTEERSTPREELPESTVCVTSCWPGFTPQGTPELTCVDGDWLEDGEVVFMCLDMEAPQFSPCPENQELWTPYGWGSVWYSIEEPKVNDNTGHWLMQLYIDGKAQNNSTLTTVLSPGTYTLTFIATDAALNQNTCTYNVTVRAADQTPPTVVFCPQSQTVESDSPVLAGWTEPVFVDDTGYIDRVDSNYDLDSVMGWGYHEVVYTAYDNTSNSASCSFTFTVNGLPCHKLELPVNGALVCHDSYTGRFCVSMCDEKGDFQVPSSDLSVPSDYLCSTSGHWYPYELIYNCLAPYGDTPTMPSEYYYHGECHQTEAQESMRQQALTLFNTLNTDISLGQDLTPEDFYVQCGPSGK